MVGLTFVRTPDTDKKTYESALGFDVIRVVDRTLYRTTHRTWEGDKGPENIDVHDYMLHCICRIKSQPEDMYFSIEEDELSEEIVYGIYTLAKETKEG